MRNTSHLGKAPIVEALIRFEANTAASWAPPTVKEQLSPKWPLHTEIQEIRSLKIELKQSVRQEPEQTITFPEVESYVFRAPNRQTVFQARRDGLIVSWLAPYETWEVFLQAAWKAWNEFEQVLHPEELHAVALRYINRLDFPAAHFELGDFFTAPPATPPEIASWSLCGFQQMSRFEIPGSPFFVQSMFIRIDGPPDNASFIVDLEVRSKESLASSGRTALENLQAMRQYKNEAFFSMLTQKAVDYYL